MAILTLETSKYAIKTEEFEGPLDLLGHLIDKNKMDIHKINLSDITDQYILYINELEDSNLEIKSEFILMASTLLLLKSKKLLPKQENEEEDVTEEELIRRIIEYKKFKEISKKLKEEYLIFSKRTYKTQEQIIFPKQKLEKDYDREIIPNMYKNILEKSSVRLNKNAKNIEKIALVEHYTVSGKVKEMIKILLKEKRFIFNRVFSITEKDKKEVVTAFSGLLELSRRNKVQTSQDILFGDIKVEKNNKKNS